MCDTIRENRDNLPYSAAPGSSSLSLSPVSCWLGLPCSTALCTGAENTGQNSVRLWEGNRCPSTWRIRGNVHATEHSLVRIFIRILNEICIVKRLHHIDPRLHFFLSKCFEVHLWLLLFQLHYVFDLISDNKLSFLWIYFFITVKQHWSSYHFIF